MQNSITKRAIRNGGILGFIVGAVGYYQGETLITSVLTWIFAWLIMGAALALSYKLTQPKTED